MVKKYQNFIRGVSVNKIGKIGVVLTTSSFISFLIFEIARILGILTNSYVGLITYLLFPTLFLIGLLLIPIGWFSYKKQRGKSTKELLDETFEQTDVKAGVFGSKLFVTILVLTLLNVIFIGGVSVQMLGFMDTPNFCGTTCHTVMNPEWVTYQQSPHARVKCVECHVGEGVDALVSSKLNGMRQMFLASLNLYNKPIPTPVHQLRPARETCEKCHWPEKFYGRKMKTFIHYQNDSSSTAKYTTLNLKIDVGQIEKSGIHWHIAQENEVRYASVDDQRKEMLWVEVIQKDGSYKRYNNKRLPNYDVHSEDIRTLDCVDCHNRATHIYEEPSTAIDERIRKGLLDRSLPYLKRESLAAISKNYRTKEAGLKGIEKHLYGFYRNNYPKIFSQKMDVIDQAIKIVGEIYSRNIHPTMNIKWGEYRSFLGHSGESGCFRCHNQNLQDDQGKFISNDCTLCHSILALEENDPFQYLKPESKQDKNFKMHKYLKDEFLHSSEK